MKARILAFLRKSERTVTPATGATVTPAANPQTSKETGK